MKPYAFTLARVTQRAVQLAFLSVASSQPGLLSLAATPRMNRRPRLTAGLTARPCR